jgi:hypothetical protein
LEIPRHFHSHVRDLTWEWLGGKLSLISIEIGHLTLRIRNGCGLIAVLRTLLLKFFTAYTDAITKGFFSLNFRTKFFLSRSRRPKVRSRMLPRRTDSS